jgi:tryptophan-rich sensory protein
VIGTSVVVLGAVVGAACSAATAPFDPGAMNMLATPEMMGIQLALRVSWPLLVAGIGWVPLLLGRAAQSAGTPVLPAEMNVVPFVVAVLACAIVWLSRRSPRRL